MQLLYFFVKIRMPWLDSVMLAVTELGGEILFLAVAIAMFWCVSKRLGYYILSVGVVGTICNQWLKLLFRISRPWVQHPDFTIVEGARAGATGYSFPSGHSQNVSATLGCPALLATKKWLKIVLWTLLALVGISRMYLGVHTPLDVGVGLGCGLILAFALRPIFKRETLRPRTMYILFACIVAVAAAYTVYVEVCPFPADIELDNLEHGTKNAYTLLGVALAMPLGFWLDQRYLHFDVRGSLPAQIVKAVVGLALAVGIRMVLKKPLNALFGGAYVADAIRYFLMTLFVMGVWPLAFPTICKLLPQKGTQK